MPLSIRNPQAELLAKEVSAISGENMTQAIIVALEERLERLKGQKSTPDLVKDILTISERCSSLPDLDPRTPDEILGYDENGVF